MKRFALSLKQPWAALVIAGLKSIEIRRWRTTYRGPLLIHAAREDDDRPEGWSRVAPSIIPLTQRRRGIIGEVELYDCRTYRHQADFNADGRLHCNEPSWFEEAGLFGFCFRRVREVPFVELPGFVRLFEVDWAEPVELPLPGPPLAVRVRLEKLMRRKSS